MQLVASPPPASEVWQSYVLPAFLLFAWVVWWLCGVRWQQAWPVLAEGAWVPFVLLGVAVALAWSQMAPSSREFLGIFTVPNFWWQLGGVGLLFALALFCGWLQGVLHCEPAAIDLEPPPYVHHEHEDHAVPEHGHPDITHDQPPPHAPGHH
jgi:hypothetical protein